MKILVFTNLLLVFAANLPKDLIDKNGNCAQGAKLLGVSGKKVCAIHAMQGTYVFCSSMCTTMKASLFLPKTPGEVNTFGHFINGIKLTSTKYTYFWLGMTDLKNQGKFKFKHKIFINFSYELQTLNSTNLIIKRKLD